MTIRISLVGAGGEPVDLTATLNGHGVANLPPVKSDPDLATDMQITLRLPDSAIRTVFVNQTEPGYANVTVLGGPASNEDQIAEAIRHVLRLDQDLTRFYQIASTDPLLSWVTTGYGRMTRCQTVFEDVIKTLLTTNCAWSATVRMVERLVTELGEPDSNIADQSPYGRAFPTPERMAGQTEQFYRETVRAGYRAPHLIRIAAAVANGEIDLESLSSRTREEQSDEDLEKELIALPGIGPYAAAHIMHMLGRASRLILDSWTRPRFAALIGAESVEDKDIVARFEPYGEYAGLAYWMMVTRDWFERQAAGEAL